jgi:RHS repeat-associated protein
VSKPPWSLCPGGVTPRIRVPRTTSVFAFGEDAGGSGTADHNFTGQNQDLVTGLLYDFPYREYHPGEGRWISPDPAGLAAVDPANPQSWNRYA